MSRRTTLGHWRPRFNRGQRRRTRQILDAFVARSLPRPVRNHHVVSLGSLRSAHIEENPRGGLRLRFVYNHGYRFA